MTCICEWSGTCGALGALECEGCSDELCACGCGETMCLCDCGGEMPCDGCADCEWADEWDAMGWEEEA